MHTTFIPRFVPCLIVVFALLGTVIGAKAVGQSMPDLPSSEPYSLSYAAGGRDNQGNFLGGTELMNLVGFEGKLYAGVGYWMDRPRLFPAHAGAPGDSQMDRSHFDPARVDPKSGAQILVLDSKHSQWRQEHVF